MKDKVPLNKLNKNKKYFYYNLNKRTTGGFADAAFLSSLILTTGLWIIIITFLGGK